MTMQPPQTETRIELILAAAPSASHEARVRYVRLLRTLAEREPSPLPVLTASADLRPPSDVKDPGVRASRAMFRERLRELEASLPNHGPEHASFAADAPRLESLVGAAAPGDTRVGAEDEGARGLLAFACSGEGLFETVRSWTPFDDRIESAPLPLIVQLARLVAREPAVVALVDTNTLRLFVAAPGRLEEVKGIDEPPGPYRKTEAAAFSQRNTQDRVDEHRAGFAREAAELVAGVVARENARRLFLAGDELAVPLLQSKLPKAEADRVRGVVRVELRATLDELEAKVLPEIEQAEGADALDAADRLVGAVRSKGLGVAGIDETLRALELGEVLELLVDAAVAESADRRAGASVDEWTANELMRRAVRTDAPVTFVSDHPGLRELGGVGALLRFRA